MTFGEKLCRLRREQNYTQDQLAAVLEVSRQSVSKWESNLAYPETEKLIKIGKLFDCTMDYLLKDEITEKKAVAEQTSVIDDRQREMPSIFWHLRERKSEKTLFGLPLYHIGKNAKGIFAVGLKASGIVSLGLFSTGVISLGLLSVGVISFGVLAIGLLALGSIALGLAAFGAIAVGLICAGALSVGLFSFGALAVGRYFAVGADAYGMIAIGKTTAFGDLYSHIGSLETADLQLVRAVLYQNLPQWMIWVKDFFMLL